MATNTSTSTSTRSFLDAINERYGAEDDSNAYSEDAFDVGATRSAKKNNKKWEMVGMDAARQKQSNHSRLSVLGLQDSNISFAEKSSGQIVAAGLKRVRELNLSDNQNLSALDIDTIVSALPSLVELQLSGTGVGNVSLWSPQAGELAGGGGARGGNSDSNFALGSTTASSTSIDEQQQQQKQVTSPLMATSSSCVSLSGGGGVLVRPGSPFRHNNWTRLSTLALNRCGITWENLLEAFPCNLVSLVSLHLESNKIGKIYPPSVRRSPSQQHAVMMALKNGEEAAVGAASPSQPEENSPFSFVPMFPALKELNLSFNEITNLDEDAEMMKFLEFDTPKLTSLNLTGNKIFINTKKNDSDEKKENYLSRLEVLYLTQNETLVCGSSSTSSQEEEPLDVLDWIRLQCPKVKSLRVSYNDLFGESNYQTSTSTTTSTNRPKSLLSEVQQRSLVIAALPQIETLNSGPVRAKERMDAEMLYLQVARAKKEQAEKAAGTSSSGSTNRFFPWKSFPLLDHLAEKHKNVVLTSLSGDGKDKNANNTNALATGNALNYALKLTFRVLSEETKQHDASASGASAAVMIQEKVSGHKVTTTSTVAMAEDVTRTVPGNMTVGKLRSFVASIYPSIASLSQQKKLQAYPNENGGIQ